MKSLFCGLFLLFASVANAGVIYQNGPDEHIDFFVRTSGSVEILPDQISLDVIDPGNTHLVLRGKVETTTFQLENISFQVDTQSPINIGFIGAIDSGTTSGGFYNGLSGESSYDFYLGQWFRDIEIIITSSAPNTIVLSNFVATGNVHHLPETPAITLILLAVLCFGAGWLIFGPREPML